MKKVFIDESLVERLGGFTGRPDFGFGVAGDHGCAADIKVESCRGDRLESGLDVLYSGGWISCQNARAVAGKLEIGLEEMGRMLDRLDIKVRSCQLGCF